MSHSHSHSTLKMQINHVVKLVNLFVYFGFIFMHVSVCVCLSLSVCVCVCVLQFSLRVFSTFDFTWQSHGFSRQIHFCCTGFCVSHFLAVKKESCRLKCRVAVAKQVTTCCPTAFDVVYALLLLQIVAVVVVTAADF